MSSLATTIEAILYLKGQPLPIAKLAELARCEREDIEEGLIDLMDDYAHRDGALEIVETVDGYGLQLKERYRFLVDMLIPLDLGVGALRTLAAIALRGPISQTDLVDLRGSGAYQHVQELLAQGFVCKRKQSDSRSSLVLVTDKFYQHFEIDQLPALRQKPSVSPADNDQGHDDGNDQSEDQGDDDQNTATEIPPEPGDPQSEETQIPSD